MASSDSWSPEPLKADEDEDDDDTLDALEAGASKRTWRGSLQSAPDEETIEAFWRSVTTSSSNRADGAGLTATAGALAEFEDGATAGTCTAATADDETTAAVGDEAEAGALNLLRKPSRRNTGSSLSVARNRSDASAHSTEQ
jgi:hypothetical protein